MTTHRLLRCVRARRASLALMLTLGATLLPTVSRADTTCLHDSDCSKGFTCQVTGTSGCPGVASCPPNVSCDAAAPPCTSQTISSCAPGPCGTDADCAGGMVCHASAFTSCVAGGGSVMCAKGDECVVVDVVFDAGGCTTSTGPLMCVPKYDLPCKVSTDCGDGFTCAAQAVTTCSGGGSVGRGSSGVNSFPPAPVDSGSSATDTCTTTTLSTSACQLNPIACTTDSNCPSTWTCVSPLVDSTFAGTPDDASAPALVSIDDAGPSAQCLPPNWSRSATGHGLASAAGSNGASGTSGTSSPSAPAAATPAAPSSGGCAITESVAKATSVGSLAALLGLVGLVGRRRSRLAK